MKRKEGKGITAMLDVATYTAIVGAVTGVGALLLSGASAYNQRRQTQIMEAGLEKALDTPDGENGTKIERTLRLVLNRRLSDNRAKMRQEFGPRLDRLEQALQEHDIAGYSKNIASLIKLLDDKKDIKDIAEEARALQAAIEVAEQRILAETGRYNADIATQGREVESVKQKLDDIQGSVQYLNAVRTHVYQIAQQLLQLASQS